jgi:hypothetical protein
LITNLVGSAIDITLVKLYIPLILTHQIIVEPKKEVKHYKTF